MSRRLFVIVSVLLDAVLINVGLIAAFLIRFGGSLPAFNFNAYLMLAPLITAGYLVLGYALGLYEPERVEDAWTLFGLVSLVTLAGFVLTFALVGFFNQPSLPRAAVIISLPIEFVLLFGWRRLVLTLFPIAWPLERVLVVGTGPVACDLAGALGTKRRRGFSLVGLIARDAEEAAGCDIGDDLEVVGTVEDITDVIAREGVDRVMVASPVAMRELLEPLAIADEITVRVDVVPELYEIFIGTVDSIVADIPLMRITREPVHGYVRMTKRALDLLFALLGIVVLSPILLLASIAVAITMGRPILFRQERVGADLKPFDVIKFRTMVRDAEAASGPVLATDDDPRITRLGRFMRTYRIDELPQLFNIVGGSMSFVGPRPERPFFVERYVEQIPGYRERFRVKPGVTGLAQVSGGYATTPERKLKYDLIYMYHQSLLMDLQIIVETVRVVLTGRGAR
jgi:exopolysaccharide biosynthesis polyprenyl glycosylphosphotransferase